MTYAAMAWHFRDVDFASQIAIFVNMTQYRNRKRHDVSLDEAAEIFNRYSDIHYAMPDLYFETRLSVSLNGSIAASCLLLYNACVRCSTKDYNLTTRSPKSALFACV